MWLLHEDATAASYVSTVSRLHHFGGYSKTHSKKLISHSCIITFERSESSRERRIALCKSDHQQHNYDDVIVQELCESRGGRPGLSVLTSLLVSVDVKLY